VRPKKVGVAWPSGVRIGSVPSALLGNDTKGVVMKSAFAGNGEPTSKVRTKRRISVLVLLVLVAGSAFLWSGISTWNHSRRLCAEYTRAVAGISAQGVVPGVYPEFALSASDSRLSFGGFVTVVVEADGRVLVLFKESVGWKGNYEGYVFANRPFRASDFSQDYYGRSVLNTPGITEPVVVGTLGDCGLQVKFDLG
jgi:hypothetical protein